MGIFWNPNASSRGGSFGTLPTQAVVTDVITNEEHKEYGITGFNVGTIPFKYMEYGSHGDATSTSFHAYPLEVSIQEYPLIGEIVLIQKVKGKHFYSRRVNVNKKLQFNSFPNVLKRLLPSQTPQDQSVAMEQASHGQLQHSTTEPKDILINEKY